MGEVSRDGYSELKGAETSRSTFKKKFAKLIEHTSFKFLQEKAYGNWIFCIFEKY